MYNGKTVSLGNIVWKAMKYPLANDLTYEEAAEFALEFIRLMGAPLIYSDVVSKPIELNQYKAKLPENLLYLKGVRYICDDCDLSIPNEGIAMKYATDIYHNGLMSDNCINNNIDDRDELQGYTYMINKGILTSSIENGFILLSYKEIATDEDGFPLVPDNEQFKLGLEYYILHRYMEPMWVAGKIPDKVFSYIEQKRHWYYSSAHTSLQMPSIDQMESIMNGINRIVINSTAQQDFFRRYGEKERIKKHH